MDINSILALINEGLTIAGSIKRAHVSHGTTAEGDSRVVIDLILDDADAGFDDALAQIDTWNKEHPTT